MSIPVKHFYMIRHGESEANAARILAGHMDSPLTAHGRSQARRARKVLEKIIFENNGIKPCAIYHSHLSRAKETAEIINTSLNLPLHKENGFAEKHSGILEGKPYEECLEEFKSWIDIEGGETAQEFFNRIKTAKIKALSAHNEPVLISCHGGVMRAIGALYGIKCPNSFKNAHLYEFIPNPENENFPWDVYDYDLCDDTNTIIKNRSHNYEPKDSDK